jgi:hypothetical protein
MPICTSRFTVPGDRAPRETEGEFSVAWAGVSALLPIRMRVKIGGMVYIEKGRD